MTEEGYPPIAWVIAFVLILSSFVFFITFTDTGEDILEDIERSEQNSSIEGEATNFIPDCSATKEAYPNVWWLFCPTPFPLVILLSIVIGPFIVIVANRLTDSDPDA